MGRLESSLCSQELILFPPFDCVFTTGMDDIGSRVFY